MITVTLLESYGPPVQYPTATSAYHDHDSLKIERNWIDAEDHHRTETVGGVRWGVVLRWEVS